jgi:hypothetical protein
LNSSFGTRRRRPLGEYSAALFVNGTSLGFNPVVNGLLYSDAFFTPPFVDIAGERHLTAGDEFRVENRGGAAFCAFALRVAGGETVRSVDWAC